jgi:hypothetical protein
MTLPAIHETRVERPIIRPALRGSCCRSWATYLVAVSPIPNPANVANMPTLLWMMPSSPKATLPSIRATGMDARRVTPCETKDPTMSQEAPVSRRVPTGEARIRCRYGRRTAGQVGAATQLNATISTFSASATSCQRLSQFVDSCHVDVRCAREGALVRWIAWCRGLHTFPHTGTPLQRASSTTRVVLGTTSCPAGRRWPISLPLRTREASTIRDGNDLSGRQLAVTRERRIQPPMSRHHA